MPPIRVLLADDHHVVRQGLATIVDLEDDMTVVAQVGDGAHAVQLIREQTPDIVLMDLQMPQLDGVQAIQQVRRECPGVRILILTAFADQEHVLAGIKAGAHGYLLKDATPEQLVQAIRSVQRGEAVLGSAVAAMVLTRFREMMPDGETPAPPFQPKPTPHVLTAREQQVLMLMAQGMRNREIAQELVVSVRTIKVYVSNILDKLDASNRTEAVAEARRRGWLV